MNVRDADMVRILEARDGPLGNAWRPHLTDDGNCRYSDLYPEGECPWCAAERSRLAAGLPPSPQRSA
ncbi:MAG TPA: hypothetical protein VH951_00350 [Dehalococcoidia bacterium]